MVPLGVSKMISKPMVRLAQTMHQSFTDTNTVSKWKEARFHITHVTVVEPPKELGPHAPIVVLTDLR